LVTQLELLDDQGFLRAGTSPQHDQHQQKIAEIHAHDSITATTGFKKQESMRHFSPSSIHRILRMIVKDD
jgi:hypothetical protein